MEQPYSIIISTCNRKSLTGLTLDSVMACKAPASRVHIIDDASDEYSEAWLCSFGSNSVLRLPERIGVGAMAKKRIEYGLHSTIADYFIFLDNDILVSPSFDSISISLLQTLESRLNTSEDDPNKPLAIFSPYRSALHEILGLALFDPGNSVKSVAAMKDIGGISMVMSRTTATHLLEHMTAWNNNWDYEVSKHIPNLYAPMQSLIEHTGRYGDGVNGESLDRAQHFIGYTFKCQN